MKEGRVPPTGAVTKSQYTPPTSSSSAVHSLVDIGVQQDVKSSEVSLASKYSYPPSVKSTPPSVSTVSEAPSSMSTSSSVSTMSPVKTGRGEGGPLTQ